MRRKTITIVLSLALAAAFIASAAVNVAQYVGYKDSMSEKDAEIESRKADEKAKADELEKNADELSQTGRELENAKTERDKLLLKLDELESKLDGANEDALIENGKREELVEQIKLLRVSLDEQNEKIAGLEESIERYGKVYSIDVKRQAELIDKILELLENGAPEILIDQTENADPGDEQDRDTPETDACAETSADAKSLAATETAADTGTAEEPQPATRKAHIALYYEDLTTGYKLAYNENDVFFSASVVKEPYILWLLTTVEQKENEAYARYLAEVAAADETTPAETATTAAVTTAAAESDAETAAESAALTPEEKKKAIIREYLEDEKYDLSRVYTYTEADKQEGSGVIAGAGEGIEYTYLDLVKYAILYSDNVAFAELRKVFGYSDFYSYARSIGAKSLIWKFNDMTAGDANTFMKATYGYFETGTEYAALLKELMLKANHRVMIPYAVYPKPTAHKYGWDVNAYHDAAVVFDEHPYSLVIFTDLDAGGDEINSYIRSVAELVDELHSNFYKDY